MNRTLPFGIHNIGYGYAIKINVKLTKKDAEDIAKTFYDKLYVTWNEKGGHAKNICIHRIEGCIHHKDITAFMVKLELAKEFRKIAECEAKISIILEAQFPMNFPEIPDSIPFEI